MGAPTIHKIPGKNIPANKIDPRHLEIWKKRREQQQNRKVVRVPAK
jgi:hypothetical protein